MQKSHRAILTPYRREGKEILVYLQKRSADMKALPNYFGFWGGKVEEGETIEEGLKREIEEELGIEISDYEHFAHYEFYGSIKDIFTLEIGSDFEKDVVIGEGDYGKFFTEQDTLNEPLILDEDRVVLRNFFGKIKKDNPHQLYL